MDRVAVYLAANGVAILMVSLAAGWLLYRTILKGQDEHGWHLLHAGGSGRGLMLIGLAGTITLLQLPVWLTRIAAWLIIIFAWSSVVAMIITALTGERGFGWFGPVANRLAYALYVMGTIAVFPAFAVFLIGFAAAL